MGKSDTFIFPEYISTLSDLTYSSIAFLGFASENQLTRSLRGSIRHFYDRELGNWEINSSWELIQKYDLIVCTRCAYFSKYPYDFIERCKSHLTDEGSALIDWGLGDHWRFNNYKVGWVRNGEHEFAYHPQNYLYSSFWNESLKNDDQVQRFWQAIKRKPEFGYNEKDSIEEVILSEVPSIVNYSTKKISTKCLWEEENPQLYIITLIKND